MSKHPHPMQPIVWAKDGVIRFKANKIIKHLLTSRQPLDLNVIATMGFPREDEEQLAQLMGYSVSGFGDLSYVRRTTVAKADAIADEMVRDRQKKHRQKEKR